MIEYQKIANIFKFDPKYKTAIGLNEPYATLKDIIWQGTEKIDGTNIRIHWDGHDIEFAGHTDKSVIPPKLNQYLTDLFLTPEMEYLFEQVFGETEAYVFGEGFGANIQNGGANYVENGTDVSFIVFDVNIGGFDLTRDNVIDVANKLGLPSVPVVFEGTLIQAIDFVSQHHMSTLNNGKHEMEGIVLVSRNIQLYDKNHHLIKCKCKYRDILKADSVLQIIHPNYTNYIIRSPWRPIKEYFEEPHDWALIQFEEKNPSHFKGLPHICEYRTNGEFGSGWYPQDAESDFHTFDYLNNMSSAISFMEWESLI